jgi:hypothetical protein
VKPPVIEFIEKVTGKLCLPVTEKQLEWDESPSYFWPLNSEIVTQNKPVFCSGPNAYSIVAVGILIETFGDLITCPCVFQDSKGFFHRFPSPPKNGTLPGPLEYSDWMQGSEHEPLYQSIMPYSAMVWGLIRAYGAQSR